LCFRYEAGGWEAAREYARQGLGIAVLPVSLVTREDRKDFITRNLPLQFHIRDLLIERDTERIPAHEAMKQALKYVSNQKELVLRG
jgi:DNA-binding transcriptional LysR family regulator